MQYKYTNFNTSHVVVYLVGGRDYITGISDFNTSHVVVYRSADSLTAVIASISIHLML